MLQSWSCEGLQVHVTALRCLRVKPGKRGLNSWLWPVLRGAGGWFSLITNHVTGNGRSTWHLRWVITLRPGALLEIFLIFHGSSMPNNKLYIIICDWGRRYSQVRFPAIQEWGRILEIACHNIWLTGLECQFSELWPLFSFFKQHEWKICLVRYLQSCIIPVQQSSHTYLIDLFAWRTSA
jgi:hypothetical protein